jgi:hypothetical protein
LFQAHRAAQIEGRISPSVHSRIQKRTLGFDPKRHRFLQENRPYFSIDPVRGDEPGGG